jgi:hypothetical protein
MSMIENLEIMRDQGILRFLAREEKKWKCPGCDEVVCCHNGLCFKCERAMLEKKINKYRWEGA